MNANEFSASLLSQLQATLAYGSSSQSYGWPSLQSVTRKATVDPGLVDDHKILHFANAVRRIKS